MYTSRNSAKLAPSWTSLRRSPSAPYLTPEWQEKMKKIEDCKHCGACKKKCPYGLDTPELLRRNYEDYKEILAGKAF